MRKVLFILGVLTDEDVEWLIKVGSKADLKAGQTLIREGESISALYIVLEGLLGVYTKHGQRLSELTAGEVVGEISFVDNRTPAATVKAEIDTSLLVIDEAILYQRLEQDHEFAARFFRAIAAFLAYRLRDTTAQLGYGRENHLDQANEVGDTMLANVYLAGTRFERVLKRLME